jgi:hypothetical protein
VEAPGGLVSWLADEFCPHRNRTHIFMIFRIGYDDPCCNGIGCFYWRGFIPMVAGLFAVSAAAKYSCFHHQNHKNLCSITFRSIQRP